MDRDESSDRELESRPQNGIAKSASFGFYHLHNRSHYSLADFLVRKVLVCKWALRCKKPLARSGCVRR